MQIKLIDLDIVLLIDLIAKSFDSLSENIDDNHSNYVEMSELIIGSI